MDVSLSAQNTICGWHYSLDEVRALMDAHTERERTVFVTVGTTSFDTLVKAVDTIQCKAALASKGYTHLLIQLGRGTYFPTKV